MSAIKVNISIDQSILEEIDQLVKNKVFPSRSTVIQKAVEEIISKINRNRLARECLKLDAKFEQALAEEGMSAETEEWPKY